MGRLGLGFDGLPARRRPGAAAGRGGGCEGDGGRAEAGAVEGGGSSCAKQQREKDNEQHK
jgi:hypothetical protein